MVTKKGPTSEAQKDMDAFMSDMAVKPIEIVERPKVPFDFNDQEASVWSTIVNSMPADWFTTGSLPLLRQYVHHIIASRNLSQLIADVSANSEKIDIKLYLRLLASQKEQSGVMSQLATKLRLTNQSLINHRGNHTVETEKDPWED